MLIIAVLAVAAGAGAYLYTRKPATEGVSPVDAGSMSAPQGTEIPDDDLLLPAGTRELPGTRLYRKGELAAAEDELESYLAVGEPEDALQARLVLAMTKAKLGRRDDARLILERVAAEGASTPYAASALVALAGIATASSDPDLARTYLDRAWMSHPGTPAGMHAALVCGDRMHDQFASEGSEKHAEWDRIRNAYSVALGALRESPARMRVVKRLMRLNDYLVFNPRVEFSGAVFVTVEPGDTISHMAVRHGSTQEMIMRINRLPNPTIRPGERLKLVGGDPAIIVDKRHLRLTLLLDGKFLREYPIGIGPGEETPPGRFAIASRIENPKWYRRGRAPLEFGDPENILGTRWLGFRQRGAGMGIGIHGSIDGKGVGERVSAGCIRMHNRDVEELFDFAKVGTRVDIIE